MVNGLGGALSSANPAIGLAGRRSASWAASLAAQPRRMHRSPVAIGRAGLAALRVARGGQVTVGQAGLAALRVARAISASRTPREDGLPGLFLRRPPLILFRRRLQWLTSPFDIAGDRAAIRPALRAADAISYRSPTLSPPTERLGDRSIPETKADVGQPNRPAALLGNLGVSSNIASGSAQYFAEPSASTPLSAQIGNLHRLSVASHAIGSVNAGAARIPAPINSYILKRWPKLGIRSQGPELLTARLSDHLARGQAFMARVARATAGLTRGQQAKALSATSLTRNVPGIAVARRDDAMRAITPLDRPLGQAPFQGRIVSVSDPQDGNFGPMGVPWTGNARRTLSMSGTAWLSARTSAARFAATGMLSLANVPYARPRAAAFANRYAAIRSVFATRNADAFTIANLRLNAVGVTRSKSMQQSPSERPASPQEAAAGKGGAQMPFSLASYLWQSALGSLGRMRRASPNDRDTTAPDFPGIRRWERGQLPYLSVAVSRQPFGETIARRDSKIVFGAQRSQQRSSLPMGSIDLITGASLPVSHPPFALSQLTRDQIPGDTRHMADDRQPAAFAEQLGAAPARRGTLADSRMVFGQHDTPFDANPAVLRADLRRRGGEGIALDSGLRARLQRHIGFDPSAARLHTGVVASEAARRLRAEAFTIGQDVFFGAGRFETTSPQGMALLAHELTHVGQQAAMARARINYWTPQGGDSMELAAQRTAANVLADMAVASAESESGQQSPTLHRDAHAPQPSMTFAMPAPAPVQGMPEPSQVATEERGGKPMPNMGQTDARALADRVYDLMRQEVILSRQRGAGLAGR